MTSTGLLDTSTAIVLGRLDAETLPNEALISSITLAELSLGPHIARSEARAYDALIAAVAIAHDLPLRTCNPRDFDLIDELNRARRPAPRPPRGAAQLIRAARSRSRRTARRAPLDHTGAARNRWGWWAHLHGEVSTVYAVVLVEGESDRVAHRTLAQRRGRDLAAQGIALVAMGGITNTRAFALHYGPLGLGVPLAGLPDEVKVRHGLATAGFRAALAPAGPSALDFCACSADLEDELIRALGVDAVEAVIEAAGESASLRLLKRMPAYRRRLSPSTCPLPWIPCWPAFG